MRRIRSRIVVGFAVALLAFACGQPAEDAARPESGAAATTTPTDASPAEGGAVGEAPAGAPFRTIIAWSEPDWPPWAITGPDGEADGFTVELIREVCAAVGLGIVVEVKPWDEIVQALALQEIDVAPNTAYTRSRARLFGFTDPHTLTRDAIFVRRLESEGIESFEDLRDRELVLQNADRALEYVMAEGLTDKIVQAETTGDVLLRLSAGEGEAALLPGPVGVELIRSMGIANLTTVGEPIAAYDRQMSFAVKAGDPDLVELLNEGIRLVKESGRYDELYDKWLGAGRQR